MSLYTNIRIHTLACATLFSYTKKLENVDLSEPDMFRIGAAHLQAVY